MRVRRRKKKNKRPTGTGVQATKIRSICNIYQFPITDKKEKKRKKQKQKQKQIDVVSETRHLKLDLTQEDYYCNVTNFFLSFFYFLFVRFVYMFSPFRQCYWIQ